MTRQALETGVGLALRLLRQDSRQALQRQFSAELQQLFGLPAVWCLDLDVSGRQLSGQRDGRDWQFACDDFSHPMAMVARDRQARLLDAVAVSRLDHAGFQSWWAGLPHGSGLYITPVSPDGKRLLGVVVLGGPLSVLNALREDPLFHHLEHLLALQWAGQLDNAGRESRQHWLKRSLEHLETGARTQSRADELSRELVGQSAPMIQLREQIVRAAGSRMAVLIQAETGCGKDLVADAIHRLSGCADGPFVVLNCAAIPESLLESELFGHKKGAFSGADADKEGLLAQADGGTLFLDEIGDMPMNLQSKLLRVLESRQFRPLGGQQEIHSRFRLVAATHQPLRQCIREGRFREDLFYRLNQFPLSIAPLRERRDDLEALSRAVIRQFREREGQGPLGISSAALCQLARYAFPGNVRELRNLLEFACVQSEPDGDIQVENLPLSWMEESEAAESQADAGADTPAVPASEVHDLRAATQAFEARVIQARLKQFGGNRARTAASLGVPKRTLAHKCQKLNLTV